VTEYPATTLALNKSKYYVLLTIPVDLRQHFNGRKQLKRSTGTIDLRDARRRQYSITTELYGQLDACKPDIRDIISDLLGWIGDADEVQRMEDEGHLEGTIMANLYAEETHDPERDKDESNINLVHEGGRRALEVYREWKAKTATPKATTSSSSGGTVLYSVAVHEYLETKPYGPVKTMRDAELSLSHFKDHVGDKPLQSITAVMIHGFAEKIGADASRETVSKKVGYVKRMMDYGVRKGWVQNNVFAGLVIDKNIGRSRLKWSGKTGQRAKMYPTRTTGYTNDQETQFFGQV
jgi:hypothetical protein